MAEWFDFPEEYYNVGSDEYLNEWEEFDGYPEPPSAHEGAVDPEGEAEKDDAIPECFRESIGRYWYGEEEETCPDAFYFETTEELEPEYEDDYSSDSDFDDEYDHHHQSGEEDELAVPPEGSIFGAVGLGPIKWPTAIPRPTHLPGKPDFPKAPHPPHPSRGPKHPHPPGRHPHPPHHKPHHRHPHHHHRHHPPHHGPPHKKPHFPHFPHHGKHHPNPHFKHKNDTIFEFLANSSHHKILYHVIKNDTSLIDIFNSTKHKVTLFAPTDFAIKRLLKHIPHKNETHRPPPKWLIKKLIEYHTVGGFYPAGRVLHHRTLSTLLEATHGPNLTQKLRVGLGFKGLTINFYAHPVFLDIFTENGVVHAIDNILLPAPPAIFILKLFPTAFSTFLQATFQTKVLKELIPFHSKSSWTIFAPTNGAWLRIPPKVIAFLFSPFGHRILTKLVEYHISPNTTFYTDSIWKFPHRPHPELPEDTDETSLPHLKPPHWKKFHFNTTLPTLIGKNATLRIDELIFGPIVKIGINGRPAGIVANDVLAYDGVIQVVNRFILPPRKRHGHHGPPHKHPHHRKPPHKDDEVTEYDGEWEWVSGFAEDDEWTIENLKEIFGDEE